MSSEGNFNETNPHASNIKEEQDSQGLDESEEEEESSYLESEIKANERPQSIEEMKMKMSAVMANFKKGKEDLLEQPNDRSSNKRSSLENTMNSFSVFKHQINH